MDIATHLAARLKQLRQTRGLSLTQAAELTAEAGRLLNRAGLEAEEIGNQARAEAAALVESAGRIERRATEHAEQIRRQAVDEAAAVCLRARDEVLAMLTTGREQRRRADAEAASVRERLDQDAATRRTALLADVDALEHRRSALRAEIARMAGAVADPRVGRLQGRVRRPVDLLRVRSRSLRTP